jgi:carbon monoxide dehydrogenase subunit G
VPLATAVTTVREDDRQARLAVVGARGVQSVSVDLTVDLAPSAAGTTVLWPANAIIHSGVTSVGQRVVGDPIATAVDVLRASAEVAVGSFA